MSETTTPAGMKLHGEIVSWDVPSGTEVQYSVLLAALDAAGLDKKIAKVMAPRNAFARAISDLSEKRIVRKLDETEALIKFQFTAESKDSDGKRLSYNYEAALTLDKQTGWVTCDDSAELVAKAKAAIDFETNTRYTADITRICQKLFDAHADLFPVRAQGGCYFVPIRFADFLNQIQTFLAGVGGGVRRFPVPAGYEQGDRSVSESVRDGLARLIEEHQTAIGTFDESTRDSTLEKTVERINVTRFKLEAYADFLTDQKDSLLAAVDAAKAKLREKVRELARGVVVPGDGVAQLAQPVEAVSNSPANVGLAAI